MSRSRIITTGFETVDAVLAARVADETEIGASLCVIRDDEVLLDTWHGSRLDGKPWLADTITPVWSTSKVMTNLTLLVLVDRGLVALEAPIQQYWPEFRSPVVTVRHALSHAAGLPAWTPSVSADDVFDWERSVADLGAQEPWWEPGTATGYHLLSQGHLVGEIIRRVTGLMPGAAIAEFLTGPLGANGEHGAFHLGVPEDQWQNISDVKLPPLLEVEPMSEDSIAWRTFTQPFLHGRAANSEAWRTAQIPGASGFGNARGVAEVQSLVSHGGARRGISVLSPDTLDEITAKPISGIDHVLRIGITFGAGWAVPEHSERLIWGGLGGSVVLSDPATRTTIAYVMNRMIAEYVPGTRQQRPCGDSRSDEYFELIWQVLDDA